MYDSAIGLLCGMHMQHHCYLRTCLHIQQSYLPVEQHMEGLEEGPGQERNTYSIRTKYSNPYHLLSIWGTCVYVLIQYKIIPTSCVVYFYNSGCLGRFLLSLCNTSVGAWSHACFRFCIICLCFGAECFLLSWTSRLGCRHWCEPGKVASSLHWPLQGNSAKS